MIGPSQVSSRAPRGGRGAHALPRGIMTMCKHETTYAIYRRGPRPQSKFIPDGQRCQDCGAVVIR